MKTKTYVSYVYRINTNFSIFWSIVYLYLFVSYRPNIVSRSTDNIDNRCITSSIINHTFTNFKVMSFLECNSFISCINSCSVRFKVGNNRTSHKIRFKNSTRSITTFYSNLRFFLISNTRRY